ncbi:hypothetical protein [Sphingomonas phyllosphaerae]|uniref:hypothetical protein n=1 Tax=Sphingomonas phyllosphaerae TaxID=257003 RepID=UPI0004192794|nr:hypothetical protein [Sphingomonas phyllosphaerae]
MAKKKGKLPKEVLGVKVPKELRKAGEKLIEQVQGPAGKQALAAVVGAVATAALSREASRAAERAANPDTPKSEAPRNEGGEALARAAELLVGKIFAPRA